MQVGLQSHTDRSHLLSTYSGKMLCSPCSISHPPDGLCEPGMSWVLNECLLKIGIGWGGNYSQVTERKPRVWEARKGQSLVWMGRNTFQVGGTAPVKVWWWEGVRKAADSQGRGLLRRDVGLMFCRLVSWADKKRKSNNNNHFQLFLYFRHVYALYSGS